MSCTDTQRLRPPVATKPRSQSGRHIHVRAIRYEQPDLQKLARALWEAALYSRTRSRGHIASMKLVRYRLIPSAEPHICWSEDCNELAPSLRSLWA
jgi:hypothetical protein